MPKITIEQELGTITGKHLRLSDCKINYRNVQFNCDKMFFDRTISLPGKNLIINAKEWYVNDDVEILLQGKNATSITYTAGHTGKNGNDGRNGENGEKKGGEWYFH